MYGKKRVMSVLLITVLLFLAACGNNTDEPSVIEETPSQIDHSNDADITDLILEEFIIGYLEKFHPEGAYGGVAISVFTRDNIILEIEHGYADNEAGLAINSDTVFSWGSVAKLIKWISAMQLYERGELDLHADIFEYIPREDFPDIIYPITMFHLMNHTAGFGYIEDSASLCPIMFRSNDFDEPIPTLGDVLREASAFDGNFAQNWQPGERVAYSNFGSALAGYVIEQASGMPFNEYVRTNIFTPLGMYNTALLPDLSDNKWVQEQREKIRSYDLSGLAYIQRLEALIYPAGAAFGTISDMAKFAMALLPDENGIPVLFENAETASLLYPTLEDVLNAPACELHGIVFFNGFVHSFNMDSEQFSGVIGHEGSLWSFRASLMIDINTGVGIVVVENTNNGLIGNRDHRYWNRFFEGFFEMQ